LLLFGEAAKLHGEHGSLTPDRTGKGGGELAERVNQSWSPKLSMLQPLGASSSVGPRSRAARRNRRRGAGLAPVGLRSLAQHIQAGFAGMTTMAADPMAGDRARLLSWALRAQHASA
jgi:hypothetical protein